MACGLYLGGFFVFGLPLKYYGDASMNHCHSIIHADTAIRAEHLLLDVLPSHHVTDYAKLFLFGLLRLYRFAHF